jgi:hypothetical protein
MFSTTVQTVLLTASTGTPVLRYELIANNRLLLIHWEPNLTMEEGVEGAKAITALVQRHGCLGALSDTRRNTLDWAELIPLLVYEEYPKAVAAGLRYRASVMAQLPTDALATFEMHNEMSIGGRLTNELFNDYEKARHWLFARLVEAEG